MFNGRQRNISVLRRIAAVCATVAMIIGAAFAANFAAEQNARNAVVAPRTATCGAQDRVLYDGKIEHIFTHELVFDTEKAFSPKNSLRDCFDKDHLTAKEFAALLDQLYDNGYALIGLDRALRAEPLYMPRGKRPLVMSFDDMTYDTVGRGCIDKLVLCDGRVCDYTANASPQTTRERENVTILESFIEKHPDFSVDGARATLCVNGYNGILGYRITPDCRVSEARMESDTVECKALVKHLKVLGYTFASHTYYHKYFNSMNARQIEKDCAAWARYIAPIAGETRVLCFPSGEHKARSSKMDVYKKHGYNVFLCVGDYDGTDYEKTARDARFVYRLPFDGTALRLYEKSYARLADTKKIYDNTRFRPFDYKGSYYY